MVFVHLNQDTVSIQFTSSQSIVACSCCVLGCNGHLEVPYSAIRKVEVVPVEEMWQRTWNSENYGRECWFGGRVLRDWILGFSYVRGGDPASEFVSVNRPGNFLQIQFDPNESKFNRWSVTVDDLDTMVEELRRRSNINQ